MPGDREGEQDIFLDRPGPDIVDDQRRSRFRTPLGNDADVGNAYRQTPRHQIARQISAGIGADGRGPPLSGEELGLIGNAAMVDARIGPGQLPKFRINRPMASHILVHPLLQVDPELTVGPHDDIGAYPSVHRHVATRIGKRNVSAVVESGDTDLLARSVHQTLSGLRESGLADRQQTKQTDPKQLARCGQRGFSDRRQGAILAGVPAHGIIGTAETEFFGEPSITRSLYTR